MADPKRRNTSGRTEALVAQGTGGDLPVSVPGTALAINVESIEEAGGTPATAHTFNTATTYIIVCPQEDVWVAMGAAPTAAADTDGNRLLKADVRVALPVEGAAISCLADTATP